MDRASFACLWSWKRAITVDMLPPRLSLGQTHLAVGANIPQKALCGQQDATPLHLLQIPVQIFSNFLKQSTWSPASLNTDAWACLPLVQANAVA